MGVFIQTAQLVAPPHLNPLHLSKPLLLIARKEDRPHSQDGHYAACRSQLQQAKSLLVVDPLKGAKWLQKTLHQIRKFEFTDLSVEVYHLLHHYYSAIMYNETLARKYYSLRQFYQAQYQAECEIEGYYHTLLQRTNPGDGLQPLPTSKLEQYYQQSQALLKQYPSYHTRLFTMLIGLLLHTHRHDFKATLLLCQISRITFGQKKYRTKTPLQIIYYYSLICMVRMRMYEDGCRTTEKGLALTEVGSFNWFKFRELMVLLCNNTDQCQEAYQHILHSMKNPGFKKLPEQEQEKWMVLKAYAIFMKYLQTDEFSRRQATNALKRLIKSAKILSKELAETSFVIYLVRALLAFISPNHDQLIRYVHLLQEQKQQYDHLGNSAFLIIDLFQILINDDFQACRLQKKERSYLLQLRAANSSRRSFSDHLYIVPIENLWIWVLFALKTDKD